MTAIALLTLLALIAWLTWACRYAPERARQHMTVGLAIYMFLQPFTEIIATLTFGLQPPEVESWIPLHLCDYAAYALGLALLLRKQWLFDFIFYAGISAGLQATIFYLSNPFTWTNPFFVENYLSHWLLMAGPIYMLGTSTLLPTHKGIYRTLGVMLVLAIPAAIVNKVLGTNIMYLCEKPPGANVLSWFPDWPGYLPFLLLIALAEFYLHYAIFLGVRRRAHLTT